MKKIVFTLAAVISFQLTMSANDLPVYLDDNQPIEARVQDALSRMTLEEKVALCHAQGKFSSAGVPRLGIPELWWSDGPHGVRMEINWNDWNHSGWTTDSVTAFPALTCLAATWNPQMSAKYGMALGEEARYREKDVMLGPGVNIYRTPLCGRNFEYMGEDPYLASIMVTPYITNLQKNGVAACVKHYALNNQELWRAFIDVEVSDRALREIYLPAFKAAADAGAWSFMGSYNKYKGEHLCHNDLMLNRILKEEWGWDGVVVSDWGGVHDTKGAAFGGLDVEMGSFTNGLTSEMGSFTWNDYNLADPYLAQLQSGEISISTVNDKAARILRLIFRTSMNRQKPFGSINTQEHLDVAREIAAEGIVLLKNAPLGKEKLLPLDASKYGTILVVGENATRSLTEGGGSSELKPRTEISPLAALKTLYGDKITYAQGYKSGRPMFENVEVIPQSVTDSLRRQAVEMAKNADIIIYVGGLNKNHHQDCESGDREQYNLPFGQDELINQLLAVQPRMIMVNISGNAVEMPWEKNVPAIIQAWYMGSEAGNALADILSGNVNPSGKLPFSYPAKLEDCGAHAFDSLCYPGDSVKVVYKDDILVGYRWHDTKNIPAKFPFGHGLSYTDFKYGIAHSSVSEVAQGESFVITVPVTNIGNVAGKEVMQLYIGDDKASVLRPVKELKGFEKISLNPGETATVIFTVSPEDLKYYDETNRQWVAEPGNFTVYIGSSSTDIRAKIPFRLK